MPVSWSEIRARTVQFVREWDGECNERAESQSFWNEFFAIFGLSRRRVASFEAPVRLREGTRGRIDLFWKGVLLVEHKSGGQSLERAHEQAIDYFPGIAAADLPRFVLVTDFARFRLDDLDTGEHHEFTLAELPARIRLFAFVLGQTTRPVQEQEPVNRKAADLMADLHDALRADGFVGHDLEGFLVRLLFCFFADDTGIIEPRDHLHDLLVRTHADGSDIGSFLALVFQVLNTAPERRQASLDEDVRRLPYVNGQLFGGAIPIPTFTASLRALLIRCSSYDWSGVNPVIFGALFQSVEHIQSRRRVQGMHYTSEANILKLIGPLFLDALQQRFAAGQSSPQALQRLLTDIKVIRLFDPACGCGNFLVVAYRSLRELELRCWQRLQALGEQIPLAVATIGIDVDACHGIEIEEFPAEIARTALWLVDHQMNVRLTDILGETVLRLPLRAAPKIVQGNALRLDWDDVCPRFLIDQSGKERRERRTPLAVIVLGNPPFIGKSLRNAEQKVDVDTVFGGASGSGELDYVACWYLKAADYIRDTAIPVAFVSTNSIAQGEQVGVLWPLLLARGISIRFAYRTFRWGNEARHNAHVHVVIIGFAFGPVGDKAQLPIYDYETPDSDVAVVVTGPHINPYLLHHASDVVVESRRTPLCVVPPILYGCKPVEDGNLLLSDADKQALLLNEPRAAAFIRPFISAHEFINGELRWCLWLVDVDPAAWRELPAVRERVERVRDFRLTSTKAQTRSLAETPYLFAEVRQPTTSYVLIPCHSSELRQYIPMGFLTSDDICANSCTAIPGATPYHFGVLQSDLHMAWVRHVCGRIKSDYRYSNEIVYNNYPWPDADADTQAAVTRAAEAVLAVRARHLARGQTLADCYDPIAMPRDLHDAHRDLSRAVERAYGVRRAFTSDRGRMEFLLDRYIRLIGQQASKPKVAPRTRQRRASTGTSATR